MSESFLPILKFGGCDEYFSFLQSVSINEFLKPAEGERYIGPSSGRGRGSGGRGRGRGDRGGYRGGYSGRGGHDAATALHFEDPAQFPLLGAAAKA